MSDAVAVTVNGEQRGLPSGTTLSELVRMLGRDPDRPGVAVAVNATVVPRAQWPERRIEPGDDIEIVAAVQGGS